MGLGMARESQRYLLKPMSNWWTGDGEMGDKMMAKPCSCAVTSRANDPCAQSVGASASPPSTRGYKGTVVYVGI